MTEGQCSARRVSFARELTSSTAAAAVASVATAIEASFQQMNDYITLNV